MRSSRCSHRCLSVSFSLLASLAHLASASCERLLWAVADGVVANAEETTPGVAPGRLVTEYCPHENPESSSEESESYSAAPRAAPELAGVRTGVVMSRLETLSSKRPVASKRRVRDVAVGRGVGAATGLAGDSYGRY